MRWTESRPVHFPEAFATIYRNLGVDVNTATKDTHMISLKMVSNPSGSILEVLKKRTGSGTNCRTSGQFSWLIYYCGTCGR